MISPAAIHAAKSEISRKIRNRAAEESARLPANALASGQYLDNDAYEQRGLYGTAATIRILAGEGANDPATLDLLNRLGFYVANRTQVERLAVSQTEYRDYVARRIKLQRGDTFRLADLAFAISFVSPAVQSRAQSLDFAKRALEGATAVPWGFSFGSEGGSSNILTTAHVVRALTANNLPTRPDDWRMLRDYVANGKDDYIACFVLYVLACYAPNADRRALQAEWRRLFGRLSFEFRANVEANFEYTRLGQQDYVRVPWQLYLIQSAARLFPLSRFNLWSIQAKLQSIVDSIASTAGFRYESSGPYLSTRTHACVYQMLVEIEDYNMSRPMPKAALLTIGATTRLLSSRLYSFVVSTSMILVALTSVFVWIFRPHVTFGQLAPNFIAEGVLAVALWSRARLKRSRSG